MTVRDRSALVTSVRGVLAGWRGSSSRGRSTTEVLGSIASGTADAHSDIDLRWSVGEEGDAAFRALPELLASVDPVESVRVDPDSAGQRNRRLVFVRFAGWPLAWRLDLEIVGTFERSVASATWSPAESALMNVVAAVKAVARGRGDVDGLLERGFARVGAVDPAGSAVSRMRALSEAAARSDPAQRDLARRVSEETDALRSEWRDGSGRP
ncbi:hypothetical protein [Curtobacterium sp. Leaf261]|uniref:hypothetical protein n=1 Tax=Curtobacterium sp. Leaf261 TaxID=1736311 RepID=UPI0006F48A6E|nr:hypothetical protein [Curtobacterium sp. Leaf261]KQO64885.1 hypothetical protein ASF23_01525 [Curtobacterium sp. Leaf261]